MRSRKAHVSYYKNFDWFSLTGSDEFKPSELDSTVYPYVEVISKKGSIISFFIYPNPVRREKHVLRKKHGRIYSVETLFKDKGPHPIDRYTVFTKDSICIFEYFHDKHKKRARPLLAGFDVLTRKGWKFYFPDRPIYHPFPSEETFFFPDITNPKVNSWGITQTFESTEEKLIRSEIQRYYYNPDKKEWVFKPKEYECFDFSEHGSLFWWSTGGGPIIKLEKCP